MIAKPKATQKRFGPFPDFFVVSRGVKGDKPVFLLDLPTSGELDEDNALLFRCAVSLLKKNPEIPAVRFMIDGWLSDFDPDFAKPRKKKR